MKKRILVYQGMHTAGGSKKSLLNLLLLLKSEYEIKVILGSPGWFEKNVKRNNLLYVENYESIKIINSKHEVKLKRLMIVFFYSLLNLRKNSKVFKKFSPDYIFLNETRDLLFVGIIAVARRKKIISFIRGEPKKVDIVRGIISWKVIALSDSLKNKLPSSIRKKTIVIPNYINTSNIIKQDFSTKTLNLGFFGSIIPLKQLEHIVEIAKLLKDYDVIFHIVGDIPMPRYEEYKKKIINEISIQNLNARFLFHGWQENALEIMKNVDLILLTSKSEGLPRVILEGMSIGVPSISYEVGGVKDLIENNCNGFVVEKNNYEEMTNKIKIIYKDREKLKSFGKNSKLKVEKQFSSKVVKDSYKNHLQ